MKVSLVFLIILFRASLILSQNPPFVKSEPLTIEKKSKIISGITVGTLDIIFGNPILSVIE